MHSARNIHDAYHMARFPRHDSAEKAAEYRSVTRYSSLSFKHIRGRRAWTTEWKRARRVSRLRRHGVLAVSGSNRLKELEQMPGSGRSCQESSRRLSTRLSLPLDSGPERVGLGVEPGLLTLSCSLETYRVSDLDHGTEKSQDPFCPQFVAWRQLH